MESIVVVAGKRTAFGAFGGSLKDVNATDLSVTAARGTLDAAGVKPEHVDHVIFGTVVQSASDAIYLPRHVGLKLGIPQHIPALGLQRLCGTGFEAWIEAARQILIGETTIALVGGAEQMSQIPFVVRGARWGYRMGSGQFEDYLQASLTDSFVQLPMALTAENLAVQNQLTREQVDQYALQSQKRFDAAVKSGLIAPEITPVILAGKKGEVRIELDEHPRGDATLESLMKLKPVFKADGVVTAGNASGIVDGAAASLLMSEVEARKRGLKPLARIVSWATVGCDPKIMGIGPVTAIQKALAKAQLKLDQMDLIEVNEAFAAQYLSVARALDLPNDRTNINGGAIAVGHPLAASGVRILNHLMYGLQRTQGRYAIGSACIGGGQGVAVILERV
jgi:acetyl-CoA acetyltransferase family protein